MAIEMGAKTSELNENQELNSGAQTNAQQAGSNESSDAKGTTENSTEIDSEAPATTAVVTYIGNGIWTDGNGKKWKNGTEVQMKVSDYDNRKDLKFMVGYGEMKVIFV